MGDTIHHALHTRKGDVGKTADPSAVPAGGKLSQKMLGWKWLIIDEISMASARMLADMDMRLRTAARAIGTMKYDKIIEKDLSAA